MGKSITDKEIVMVNNKPMWKSDFDKLQNEDSKSIFIGITNSSSIDYMSCGQDILLYIVKVKNKNPFKINSVIKKLVETNKLYVRSITSDNGFEFDKIGILAK